MIKFVYALFVGILLSVFVGVGILTFYPEPKYPEHPGLRVELTTLNASPVGDLLRTQQDAQYQESMDQYRKDMSVYNRNVSIIAVVAAVLFMATGLALASRIHILSDGAVLGGVLTLIYGMGRSFGVDDSGYRFIIVTVGLVVALALGYWRFIKPDQSKAKIKR